MAISDSNRQFIDNLIDYYISESESYKQMAEQYVPEIESVADAAFGIIAGCVYSSFLEMCRNQDIQPGLEEMTEFSRMLKERAPVIKKAIIDPSSIATKESGSAVDDAEDNDNEDNSDDYDKDVQTKEPDSTENDGENNQTKEQPASVIGSTTTRKADYASGKTLDSKDASHEQATV